MARPEQSSPAYPAWKIEADRRRAEYAAAKETLEKLEGNTSPTWGCGTPMEPSDARDMLKRAMATVEYGNEHWREYLDA